MDKSKFHANITNTDNISYQIYNSPVGKIYLIGSDDLLLSILFDNKSRIRFVEKNIKTGKSLSIKTGILFLENYFTGKSKNFKLLKSGKNKNHITLQCGSTPDRLILDTSSFTDNEILIYKKLLTIASGSTISYGALSERAGIPMGARFVGNTMGKNFFPILIPCHRVIKSDNTMGNYSGGIHIKKFLLDFEQGK